MYLDYAEMQAARSRAITMKDWIEKLNALNNEVRFYTAKRRRLYLSYRYRALQE